ncbi:MAG: trigger factor [Actinobacteria bacterium]|nr:trigger factor [Actinomycetota bacterium]
MTVKAEMEEVEKNKVRIKVEVPAEEVSRAIDRAFRDIAREVFVPGFRRGRVPRRVLQARLGMEPVYEEVKQSNLPDYYREALEQLDLEPIAEPEIDLEEIEIEEGKPLSFQAVVEVKPRVELTGYKGVVVERPEEEVTEEEVQRALDNLRERFAQLEVASGKTLSDGDYALIDFEGTVNGQPFEGGSAKDFMLEVGSENIWPEFNQELRGKRKGDILDVKVKMPEQFPDPEMAGKIASFKVLVKEVKVKKLPEADDDFAKEASKFDTIQELKEDIRGRLQEMKSERARESVRLQVLRKLADGLEVEVPRRMVDEYVQRRRRDLEARLATRGIALESYLKAVNYTEKRMEEEFGEEAERLIRNELVLDAVVRAEGLEVSDEELEKEIERRADMLGLKPETLRSAIQEREGLEDLRVDLLRDKALRLLGEHAVFADEGEGQSPAQTGSADHGEEEEGGEASASAGAGASGGEGEEATPRE